MKISWNTEKNEKLKLERDISFDIIKNKIINGDVLDTVSNEDKYKNQKVFIIEYNDYCYAVPFVESENEIFLKTIFPSRKLTKQYLGGIKDEKYNIR